jgi:hypothetical protein
MIMERINRGKLCATSKMSKNRQKSDKKIDRFSLKSHLGSKKWQKIVSQKSLGSKGII